MTTYNEVADTLCQLPEILRAERQARGLSMQQAGSQIGVSASTVHRLEYGRGCSIRNAAAILRWAGGES